MSLQNASIVTGPSAFAPTGGTALTFSPLGTPQNGTVKLYATADTDLRLRRSLEVTVKPPVANATMPNGYSQARTEFVYKQPKLLANGKITINTVRATIAFDWETTSPEIDMLTVVAAQLFTDADFSAAIRAMSLN